MLQRLPRIAAFFGLTGFTFRLNGRERDRLIYISMLPLFVIAAIVFELYIRIHSGNLKPCWPTTIVLPQCRRR
jgi:hypothetical protein